MVKFDLRAGNAEQKLASLQAVCLAPLDKAEYASRLYQSMSADHLQPAYRTVRELHRLYLNVQLK